MKHLDRAQNMKNTSAYSKDMSQKRSIRVTLFTHSISSVSAVNDIHRYIVQKKSIDLHRNH